jgi:hypothetical protein
MTDDPAPVLLPAPPEDVERALAFALRFDGRKRFRHSGELMAEIVAAHLLKYLTQSGYVVARDPARGTHPVPVNWTLPKKPDTP